jgi:hypothetical protein
VTKRQMLGAGAGWVVSAGITVPVTLAAQLGTSAAFLLGLGSGYVCCVVGMFLVERSRHPASGRHGGEHPHGLAVHARRGAPRLRGHG